MLPSTLIARLEEAMALQAERKREQQEKIKTIIENLKIKMQNNQE